ncbi:hypothetical protein RUND412_003659 [Rhizina undulata]
MFFKRKHEQEAIDRGDYVDIHDIDPDRGFYPSEYDVLLTDITHHKLENKISEHVGIPYLSTADGDKAKKVIQAIEGYIYGPNKRTILPFIVSYRKEARWLFFILDSGSPYTYISREAGKIFGIEENSDMETAVTIGGYPKEIRLSPAHSHFPEANVLGTEFCRVNRVRIWQDYANCKVKLYFGGNWKVVKESKIVP